MTVGYVTACFAIQKPKDRLLTGTRMFRMSILQNGLAILVFRMLDQEGGTTRQIEFVKTYS